MASWISGSTEATVFPPAFKDWRKFHSDSDHTESSSLHDHNACNGLSSSLKHRSHSGLSVMGITTSSPHEVFDLAWNLQSPDVEPEVSVFTLHCFSHFLVSLVLQESISGFAGVLPILCPWPKQPVFCRVSWQWNFLNESNFLGNK